jgi:hypothetical protein
MLAKAMNLSADTFDHIEATATPWQVWYWKLLVVSFLRRILSSPAAVTFVPLEINKNRIDKVKVTIEANKTCNRYEG